MEFKFLRIIQLPYVLILTKHCYYELIETFDRHFF